MSKKEPFDTILVGSDGELFACYARLKRQKRVMGVFCPYGVLLPEGLRRIGEVCDAVPFMSANTCVRRVYCGVLSFSKDEVRLLQEECKIRAVRFCVVMPMLNDLGADYVTERMDGSLVITPKREPLTRLSNRCVKRVFDLFFVFLVLLTIFPFVYLFKAFFIKRKERGSSFMACPCVGSDGHPFKRVCFKGDARSLASVFNVLKGDMSLVGPAYFDLSEDENVHALPKRVERRVVKSGITGWSRIRKTEPGSREQYEADVWYVEHWSLWLDFCILFRSMFM